MSRSANSEMSQKIMTTLIWSGIEDIDLLKSRFASVNTGSRAVSLFSGSRHWKKKIYSPCWSYRTRRGKKKRNEIVHEWLVSLGKTWRIMQQKNGDILNNRLFKFREPWAIGSCECWEQERNEQWRRLLLERVKNIPSDNLRRRVFLW